MKKTKKAVRKPAAKAAGNKKPGKTAVKAATRRAAKPGERGEILARGPNVFSGYRHLPDDTRRAFTADGWFRTGDLGYRDADGFVYVLGRLSTMIVAESGKNIDPEAVEDVYLASGVICEIGVLQVAGKLVAVIVPDPAKIPARNGNHSCAFRPAVLFSPSSLISHYPTISYSSPVNQAHSDTPPTFA